MRRSMMLAMLLAGTPIRAIPATVLAGPAPASDAIMREQGIDTWQLMSREYFKEPVLPPMLDADNMHARRRTILISHDPGDGAPVEQLTVSRTNRIQDLLLASFREGASGNEILAEARRKALADGLDPSIHNHPIGFHGHGAGSAMGLWDNQNTDPRGVYPVHAGTTWSIELTSYCAVPEWGGQRVDFRWEEDAYFDGKAVRLLDERPTELTLISSD